MTATVISMANKPINPDTWDDYTQKGDVEVLPNNQRCCGYLKAGNAYVRCDPSAFSSDGVLPGFVVPLDANGELHPIPYKESIPRGYETFSGTNFLAAADQIRQWTPLYPGDADASESHTEAHQRAVQNLVDADVYPSVDAVPSSELQRHLDRMAIDGVEASHWGAMKPANSKDLLMRAGKSYYDHPWDFIDEALELGLNKGISVHDNKRPPVIQPGRTRCWLIHPHACGEDMPGVIGYSYLTRAVYTRDKDGEIPNYAEEYADAGRIDVVEVGEPQPLEDDEGRDYDDIAESHRDLDEFEPEEPTDPVEQGDLVEVTEAEAEADADADSTVEAIGEALTGGSNTELQQAEDIEKADLGSLVGEGFVPAGRPPKDHDVLEGGGIIGIIQQNGSDRKVSASNNWKFDETTKMGETRLGPYTVELDVTDGGRYIQVTDS